MDRKRLLGELGVTALYALAFLILSRSDIPNMIKPKIYWYSARVFNTVSIQTGDWALKLRTAYQSAMGAAKL